MTRDQDGFDISNGRPVTLAPNGMVTSPHSLASSAGIDVLRAGGSAIDAAIAAGAVLAVVYPHMTGLGGDAFWLIHDGGSGEINYLNGGGKAAAGASLAALRGTRVSEIPLRGIVPGDADGAGRRSRAGSPRMSATAGCRCGACSKPRSATRAKAFR